MDKCNCGHAVNKHISTGCLESQVTGGSMVYCGCKKDASKAGYFATRLPPKRNLTDLYTPEQLKRYGVEDEPTEVATDTRLTFHRIGEEAGKLVQEKNEAYGDAFAKAGEILKVLYPNGIKVEQYTDALATVRILDKLFRISTRKDAFGESPYRDIIGYGILGAAKDEQK